MAGALGSAGVAMLAPLSLGLAKRYDIDRRMIGLLVIHGAGAGNFSPLNPLGAIVSGAVARGGLTMSSTTLFVGNLLYNLALAVVIFFVFGGRGLLRDVGRPFRAGEADVGRPFRAGEADVGRPFRAGEADVGRPFRAGEADVGRPFRAGSFRIDQICTLVALVAVAVAALAFGLNIGFLAFAAAAAIQLIFPSSGADADKKIAWSVVLLVCGIVTYVAALQRYGTVQAVGDGIAAMSTPLVTALLICAVGAVTSAFASSAGILGAMIPLAVPFMARGEIETTGFVVALALSATVVDAAPFSTVGALVVASAEEDERQRIYRGLLLWGAAMVLTAPFLTWLIFVVLG
jgi:di/tricarboxylate transporter